LPRVRRGERGCSRWTASGFLESRELFLSFAIAVPIQVAINYLFGIYQGIWRYTSLPDIQRIVFAVLCGSVAIAISLQLFGIDNAFGYREYILYPLFLVSLMSLSRMAFRSFKEWSLYGRGGEQGTPVMILGRGRRRRRAGEGNVAQP
jgi:FlaA1/EpsC-like NDP-sugar epimerase